MIGVVIVSHSAKLAEGVCELAAQMGQGRVRLAAAGGTSDAENPIGTDAYKVLAAIESVYSDDGVLVFMDLGSAVLSAETAMELLDDERRAHVQLCPGPVVERAVEAVSLAAAGADEIFAGPVESVEVTLADPLGLHARPAAALIRTARKFRAQVTVEGVAADSINALLALGARHGHRLRLSARGPDAGEALIALAAALGTPTAIPASAGIAVGPLYKLPASKLDAAGYQVEDPAAEHQRLLDAVRHARADTGVLEEWARTHAGANEAAIFDAQLLWLEDPELVGCASRAILEDGRNAEFAWQTAAAAVDHRAGDVRDVAARVMHRLTQAQEAPVRLAAPAVVAAHDLTPSQVTQLDPQLTLGICLESGSASAHSVILARAMGIPAVVGAGEALSGVADGTIVAMDGERGQLWIAPTKEEIAGLEAKRTEWMAAREAARADRHKPACTRDGRRVRVFANISSVEEARAAVDCGAEGVGVLRTEFLFLGRTSPASEEEQTAAYRAIAAALGGRPLVIRTLDVGGDKSLPYVEIGAEANPFLGWRGIRLTLDRQELLDTQLRAICAASAGHNVQILLPMVSSLDELRQVKALLGGSAIALGVMIETPAAVAIADQLAREAAFFSIGTNDLAQYVMAADRTNARVAALADPLQPAVLRILRQAVEAGRAAGIPVTLCGELAADTRATPLLLGLGIEEFSLSAPLIPDLKRAIGSLSMAEAEAIAAKAMAMETRDEVRRLLAGC